MVTLAAVLVACLVAVGAVVAISLAPRTVSEVAVSPEGFEVSISGVTARAPGGVAPVGTIVRLEAAVVDLPVEVTTFAIELGASVRLTIGDGLQPSQPVTFEFALDPNRFPDPEAEPFALIESDSVIGAEFAESNWDPQRATLSVKAEHLSWLAPVGVSSKGLGEQLGDWINSLLGSETTRPECVSNTVDLALGQLSIGPPSDEVVWPCLSRQGDTIELSLQSNSGLVWEILTEPKGAPLPVTASSLAGLVTAALANQLAESLEGDSVLIPLETAKFEYTPSDPPQQVALRTEPGLSQIATIIWGLTMLFPAKWLENLKDAECLLDIVGGASAGASAEVTRAVLECAAEALGGVVGGIVGILLSGPALLSSQLEGAIREINQTNVVAFTTQLTPYPTEVLTLPAGAQWLHEVPSTGTSSSGDEDSADVVDNGRLYEYRNSTNQWIGCDGTVAKIVFALDGQWTELSMAFGLQTATPDGLSAQLVISGDGTPLLTTTVTQGTVLSRRVIDVTGVTNLEVEASTQDRCGFSPEGYGAFLDTYVR